MAVREGEVYYTEHVTTDVDATRAVLEALHGWRFSDPDPALGGSIVAKTPGGARCGIRAPLRETEMPITRAYVRVASAARAVARARRKGAEIALPPTRLGKHGTIAIYILAGVEHAVWQLPARSPSAPAPRRAADSRMRA